MSTRTIVGIVVNLLAVLTPVYFLYSIYGFDTTVDPREIVDLLALVGTTAGAFILGLVATHTAKRAPSMFDAFLEIMRPPARNKHLR